MKSIYNLYNYREQLQVKIESLQKSLLNAPEGTLFTRKNTDGTYKYFKCIQQDNKSREIYLGKKALDEANLLAAKKVDFLKIEDMQKELRIVENLIRLSNQESRFSHFLETHPGIAELYFSTRQPENEILTWKNQDYNRNQNYPDALIYSTVVPDLKVRSKAEADIVSRLEYYGVPYHYDEVIQINDGYLSMDFVCLNLRTRAIWYWDHRGMMDKEEYINKVLYCDREYLKAGIIPWVNMIVTTETKRYPLDILWVDHLIQYYLL